MVDWSGHTASEETAGEESGEFDDTETSELLNYLGKLDHEIIQKIHSRHRLSAYLNKRMNDRFDTLGRLNTAFNENLNEPMKKSVPF